MFGVSCNLYGRLQLREGKGNETAHLYSTYSTSSALKVLSHGSHSFTCKLHHGCPSFLSIHPMAPPRLRQRTSNSSLLIYRPRRHERLSWPGWLAYNGRSTHISGHPSATGRAQDRESSSAKDQLSICLLYTSDAADE